MYLPNILCFETILRRIIEDCILKLKDHSTAFRDVTGYKLARYSKEQSIKAFKCSYGEWAEGHLGCHATAAHDHWLPNEFNNFCFRFNAVNRKSHLIIPSNPRVQNDLTVSLHKFLSETLVGKAAKSKDILSRVVRLCSKQLSLR